MKLNERKTIGLGDDAATLRECGNPSSKAPRLTIHISQYAEGGVLFPAATAIVFGQSVRDLYDMLREYYGDAPGVVATEGARQ